MRLLIFVLSGLLLLNCNTQTDQNDSPVETRKLFRLVSAETSQIKFVNSLTENLEFNFISYPYIYIGGGVAVGDINNDGYQDIYFTSNQGANGLYLNNGDLSFTNITSQAGVADDSGWSTGTSMVDINSDGLLDIYVCKSASLRNDVLRRNKFFINQGDNRFIDQAGLLGLDHPGFSTQSYFFDYDNDGDLDMYLVNHRPDFKNNSKIDSQIQRAIYEESSDQLFRNDGASFTKVSQQAGILNKAWGLSAAIGDFNEDGWPDIYVANDYLEPDMLYINNKDGSFSNEVLSRMKHISFNSMGSDYADINNDLLPDLLVLDMLAEDHSRSKENMASMSTENFNAMVNVGYHHQYMANILQLNNGDGTYSDIGQLAGITQTDWSWAPLIADFNNDGFKDIFITNGIEKDLGNQDFRRNIRTLNSQGQALTLEQLLNMAPSEKLPNYIFENNGDLSFSNRISEWGLEHKINSNGAAYADLDNDGDLDLIINNENAMASIYENHTTNDFLQVKLNGPDGNRFGIGAKVILNSDKGSQLQEQFPNRGFQSSVTDILHFGLGKDTEITSLVVEWPNGQKSVVKDVESNQLLNIDFSDESVDAELTRTNASLFEPIPIASRNISFVHSEQVFDDFSKQLLLPHKYSTLGPCLAVSDVNADGLDDFFIGGASGQASAIYIQLKDGTFKVQANPLLTQDTNYEDLGALFFDADNDGDQDLYVAGGSYEFEEDDRRLQDRLYINSGNGTFNKRGILPTMLSCTKAVKAFDFDGDGDNDLVVGGTVIPGKYPLSPESFILRNDGGQFTDVTDQVAPDFRNIGMVTDLEITDYDGDGSEDIVAVGQWMPFTILSEINGVYSNLQLEDMDQTNGWYFSLAVADMDKDGDMDFIAGNLGMNNKFKPTQEKPLHIFSSDFDDNGSYDLALSKYYKGQLVPVRGKECSSEQTPYLIDKIDTYKEFGSLNIEQVYGIESISNANKMQAYNFESLYIENKGDGKFKFSSLPHPSQLSPVQDMIVQDINGDGNFDLIGVGNLYDAEVETIRYDSSTGFVLYGDGSGSFSNGVGLGCHSDMRAAAMLYIGNERHLLVASNNDPLKLFRTN